MKTVKEILEISTLYLTNALDIPFVTARREIELLLSHLLKCDRVGVYLRFESLLNEDDLNTFRTFLTRRSTSEPIQWIIGSIDFCGNTIQTPKHVFIPRPETEVWVDWLSHLPEELFPDKIQPTSVLEIGVGTGAILCSLLKKWQNTVGVGLDISSEAIVTSRLNSELLNVSDRAQFFQIKAGEFHLDKNSFPFDLVVSNPPYIPISDKILLSKNVMFEPSEALFAGEDGLDAYRTFLKKIPQWLTKNGKYVFEVGIHQAENVQKLLKPISSYQLIRNDLAGIPRIVGGIYR